MDSVSAISQCHYEKNKLIRQVIMFTKHAFSTLTVVVYAGGIRNLISELFLQANDPDSGPWGEVKYTIYGSGSDL